MAMHSLTTTLCAALLLLSAATARAEAAAAPDAASETAATPVRFALGAGAGPQSGNGLHLIVSRGRDAVDLGVGVLYDDSDAKWGYSTGLRYLRTLYAGLANDTYAWAGGALTGNYRNQTASHITSFGAGLGVAFHFGLPIHLYFDSGLAAYLSEGLRKREYYPAFNGGVYYAW